MKTISKRNGNVIWDKPENYFGSLKVTLTDELQDIGIDPEKVDLDKSITVSVVDDNNKKKIIIEKVEK